MANICIHPDIIQKNKAVTFHAQILHSIDTDIQYWILKTKPALLELPFASVCLIYAFLCDLKATTVSSRVWSQCISVVFSASGSPLYQLITAHFPLKASQWAAGPAKQRGHFLHHAGRKACRCQSQLKSIWPWATPHCAHHTSFKPIRYNLNYSL